MYEDLVKAQQSSVLERLVLGTIIPSLALTSILHADVVWRSDAKRLALRSEGQFYVQLVSEDRTGLTGGRVFIGCMIYIEKIPGPGGTGIGHAR